MATFPSLPSLEGLVSRLADVNQAIDAARAKPIAQERVHEKAKRRSGAMASALESI